MNKKFSDILEDRKYGEEAKKVYREGLEVLDLIEKSKLLSLNGVIGIYPANSIKDDIIVYKDEKRDNEIVRFNMLRFQEERKNADFIALSDYIAPRDTNIKDYVGAFVLTAGIGVDKLVEDFEKDGESFKAILAKILADRLAEAFAEHIHERVRKEFWGYEKNENFKIEDLVKEKYKGIRPAIGYPSIPDHSEKLKLKELFDFESITGTKLTSSYMLEPAASVCGLYIGNKHAEYFNVGKINESQLNDYSIRKGLKVEDIKKLMSDRIV